VRTLLLTFLLTVQVIQINSANERASLVIIWLSAVTQSVPPRVDMKGFKMYHPGMGYGTAQ
jgi:hypothetical protein